jgi:hypothetical protein
MYIGLQFKEQMQKAEQKVVQKQQQQMPLQPHQVQKVQQQTRVFGKNMLDVVKNVNKRGGGGGGCRSCGN